MVVRGESPCNEIFSLDKVHPDLLTHNTDFVNEQKIGIDNDYSFNNLVRLSKDPCLFTLYHVLFTSVINVIYILGATVF